MEESKKIYKTIQSKILEINSEISLPKNVNKDIAENLVNSSNQIKEILKNLESEINNLKNLSEWDHYTISFIGETNAGKSTIIEALRIKYEEEQKKNAYTKNQELLLVQQNDINENIYNISIKRILTEQCNLLQENIESGFKESVEKVNKQIHKSLSIFLDRLSRK